MASLPAIPRRSPAGPLGYLNYPPEIMKLVYEYVFINHSDILVFLYSSHPRRCQIDLKRSVNNSDQPSTELRWSHFYDSRCYVDSNGKSGQFLRVCKKVWLEGTPVLYGNLRIAVRPSPALDPCLVEHFKSNSAYILPLAKIIPIENESPFTDQMSPWVLLNLHHVDLDERQISPILMQAVGRGAAAVVEELGRENRS